MFSSEIESVRIKEIPFSRVSASFIVLAPMREIIEDYLRCNEENTAGVIFGLF